jgi:hypothetical protein
MGADALDLPPSRGALGAGAELTATVMLVGAAGIIKLVTVHVEEALSAGVPTIVIDVNGDYPVKYQRDGAIGTVS